jgi:hypothetical protein
MAVQFLTGLNVNGNININTNQLQNAVIQPLATDPAGIDGRIYYNSGTNKLKIYNGTDWVSFQTGSDGDTTYDLFGVGSTNGSAGIQLDGSDGTLDNVLIVGAGTVGVTRSGNTLTVTGTDSAAGTVTSVDGSGGSTGLTLTGGAITTAGTLTLGGTLIAANGGTGQSSYTVGDILYASSTTALSKLGIGSTGQVLKVASGIPSWATDQNSGGTVTSITNAADSGTGTAITGSGTFTFTGGTNVTTSISGTTVTINSTDQFDGTVKSVSAGLGLTQTGSSTVNPTILVDYSSTGLIADATAATPNVEGADEFLVSDNSAGNAVRRAKVSEMPISVLGQALSNVNLNSNKIINLTNPTAAQDAATKAYVDSSNLGQSVFQGGYNAASNTPNLDTTSNIAVTRGFFYAVTDAGTFFAENVQPGDLIYADVDQPANDAGNVAARWVVVQSGQDIAGVGATDGATVKGVTGFSSATFNVTSNGFTTVKNGGIILGTQTTGSYNPTVGTDTDINTAGVQVMDQINVTDGVITSMSKRTLPTSLTSAVGVIALATQAEVDAGTIANKAVTPATLSALTDDNSFSGTFPPSSAATWTITAAAHGLGTGPFIIQTYISSTGVQVYTDVVITPANGNVVFTTSDAQPTNAIRCNIMKIR